MLYTSYSALPHSGLWEPSSMEKCCGKEADPRDNMLPRMPTHAQPSTDITVLKRIGPNQTALITFKHPYTAFPYRYKPLGSADKKIRLFELLPGEYDDAFHGQLTEHALQAGLQFEALSYMWGDASPTTTINFGEAQLAIAHNLQQALRRLRYKDQSRILWIDAICINQASVEERNQQVPLMHKIYQMARMVCAWVDYDLDLESPGFKALINLEESADSEIQFEEDPDVWEPIVGFLQNPYWNRVWVQQELVTASDVQFLCRNCTISLDAIAMFQLQIRQRTFTLDSGFTSKWYLIFTGCEIGKSPARAIDESRIRFAMRGIDNMVLSEAVLPTLPPEYHDLGRPLRANSRGTLLHSLNGYRYLNTTDPRDRVYALLGIASDCDSNPIPINYGASLESCFTDVVEFIIMRYGSLDFLCHVRLPVEAATTVESRPSWLPDWDSQENHPEIFSSDNGACGEWKTLPSTISACKKKLHVQGFHLDTLHHVDIVKSLEAAETYGFVGHVLELSKIMNTQRQNTSADELVLQNITIPDQLLLTICHKFEGLVQSLNDVEKIRHGMLVLYKIAVWLNNQGQGEYQLFLLRDFLAAVKDSDFLAGVEESDKQFIFNVIWAMAGKCFVLTEKGNAGLILSSSAQVGDEVWILSGCSMPVVLRPVDDHYIFVTPLSISGFMGGEAVEGVLSGVKDGDRFGDYVVRTIELK